jgi:hypothetical protein
MQYKLVVHPEWKIKYINGDNSRGNDQTNFIAPNVRLIDSWTYLSRRSTFVDVYAVPMYGPVEGSRHVTAPTVVQILDIEYEHIEISFEWISLLQVFATWKASRLFVQTGVVRYSMKSTNKMCKSPITISTLSLGADNQFLDDLGS